MDTSGIEIRSFCIPSNHSSDAFERYEKHRRIRQNERQIYIFVKEILKEIEVSTDIQQCDPSVKHT